MRGPKPKPVDHLMQRGTFNITRHSKRGRPKTDHSKPILPNNRLPRERYFWQRYVKPLIDCGRVTKLHESQLHEWVRLLAMSEAFLKAFEKGDLKAGDTYLRYSRQATAIGNKFGCNPVDERALVEAPEPPKSKLEELDAA